MRLGFHPRIGPVSLLSIQGQVYLQLTKVEYCNDRYSRHERKYYSNTETAQKLQDISRVVTAPLNAKKNVRTGMCIANKAKTWIRIFFVIYYATECNTRTLAVELSLCDFDVIRYTIFCIAS